MTLLKIDSNCIQQNIVSKNLIKRVWSCILILSTFFLVNGCVLKDPPKGNKELVKEILGKRVGVVLTVEPYVYREKEYEHTFEYKNFYAIDSKMLAYHWAITTIEPIQKYLMGTFEIVDLSSHRKSYKTKTDLIFENERILVTPNTHSRTFPPDDKLKSIMKSKKLDGLIVVAQTWVFSDLTKSIICSFSISLMNSQEDEIFSIMPASFYDTRVNVSESYTTWRDVIKTAAFQKLSYSNEHIVNIVNEIAQGVGPKIVENINEFIKG